MSNSPEENFRNYIKNKLELNCIQYFNPVASEVQKYKRGEITNTHFATNIVAIVQNYLYKNKEIDTAFYNEIFGTKQYTTEPETDNLFQAFGLIPATLHPETYDGLKKLFVNSIIATTLSKKLNYNLNNYKFISDYYAFLSLKILKNESDYLTPEYYEQFAPVITQLFEEYNQPQYEQTQYEQTQYEPPPGVHRSFLPQQPQYEQPPHYVHRSFRHPHRTPPKPTFGDLMKKIQKQMEKNRFANKYAREQYKQQWRGQPQGYGQQWGGQPQGHSQEHSQEQQQGYDQPPGQGQSQESAWEPVINEIKKIQKETYADENTEDTKDKPCPVKDTKPAVLKCWDKKSKLAYHPDKNPGCEERSTKIFQLYSNFHEAHNEKKDNLFPKKCP